MPTLSSRWERLTAPDVTAAQVDTDLLRHGLDPREARDLISRVSRQFGVAFGTGMLAGIWMGLACRGRAPRPTNMSDAGRGRVIPFPGTDVVQSQRGPGRQNDLLAHDVHVP